MYAPIVVFAYQRPDLLKELLSSVALCPEAAESPLITFIDGAKNKADKEQTDRCAAVVESLSSNFASLEMHRSNVNLGLAKSIIGGVSDVMQRYGQAIVLEDDLVVSPHFLSFMNEALCIYKERTDIWSVSGYTPQLNLPSDYNEQVFLVPRAQCWGWCTWVDRWQTVEWQPARLTRQEQQMFNRGGNDLSQTLEMVRRGRIDAWAVLWAWAASKHGLWTVNPCHSLVANTGTASSSNHRGWHDNRHNTVLSAIRPEPSPTVTPNTEIIKLFRKHHDLGIISRIGYFMRVHGLGYDFFKRIMRRIGR